MVCYPEVQKKAQTELDNVLNGRLPDHSDILSLPYLSAIVKEVFRYAAIVSNIYFFMLNVSTSFRWEPITPIGRPLFFPDIDGNKLTSLSRQGAPHLSTNDDLYNDYHIPAKSVVIPNQW
jgi:hypothetical protein